MSASAAGTQTAEMDSLKALEMVHEMLWCYSSLREIKKRNLQGHAANLELHQTMRAQIAVVVHNEKAHLFQADGRKMVYNCRNLLKTASLSTFVTITASGKDLTFFNIRIGIFRHSLKVTHH